MKKVLRETLAGIRKKDREYLAVTAVISVLFLLFAYESTSPLYPYIHGLDSSFFMMTALLSIGLGLFNLLPIPPLDGAKVLFSLLPERAYLTLMRYERYGMAVLLLLVWLNIGGSYLSEAMYRVYLWMARLFF